MVLEESEPVVGKTALAKRKPKRANPLRRKYSMARVTLKVANDQ